jgi:hypothetical protein
MLKLFLSFFKPQPKNITRLRTRTKYRITCGNHYFVVVSEDLISLEEIRQRILFNLNNTNYISNDELPLYTHHFDTKTPIVIHEIYRKQTIF